MARSARRRWLVVALVLVVVATVATVLVVRRLGGPDTRLGAAMQLAPQDAVRFGWTDWAAVREEVGADVSASTGGRDLDRFLDAAFDADLSSMSALVSSAPDLQDRYGVSPASLDWELLAQSSAGAVVLMGLPDDLDLAELRARLVRLGYTEPDEADGVWQGGPGLLPEIGSLTPELAHLSIDDEHRVLAASDQQATLRDLPGAQRADADVAAADSPDGSAGGIEEVVEALGEVASAAVYSGDHACAALAMTQADEDDQSTAAGLVDEAGGVHAYDAFAIGGPVEDDLVRVTMAFEDEDRARADADSRSRLAAGAAPGQGGTFGERFSVDEVVAEGRRLTMDLAPEPGAYVLSDMANGPVLFATC
ncbi:hypothetical protein [Nocardioides sambongensis]|uniref:hypothetical protein n=1 Tax=Nocardioides sambongensis TaxID=2589074 RepID=UPI00112629A8|nr:hypothetical protein [Nocardioides sambongensis]